LGPGRLIWDWWNLNSHPLSVIRTKSAAPEKSKAEVRKGGPYLGLIFPVNVNGTGAVPALTGDTACTTDVGAAQIANARTWDLSGDPARRDLLALQRYVIWFVRRFAADSRHKPTKPANIKADELASGTVWFGLTTVPSA
jgi:hypothetical protein